MFQQLMSRRRRKLLDSVFVAAETGVMKQDHAGLLHSEAELFEKLVAALQDAAASLSCRVNTTTGDGARLLNNAGAK